MKKAVQQLPEGYEEKSRIDLQKNKKEAVLVNSIAAVIMVVMYLIMQKIYPYGEWMENFETLGELAAILLVFAVSFVAYIILHEFTHGATMKFFGGEEVKYGFTGLYAFAGSEKDYFPKKPYICIALAPLVLWGVVFAVLMTLFPKWIWVFWGLQMANVSGAAGDMYVSVKVSGMEEDILVMDTGVDMTVFGKRSSAKGR